MYGWALHVRTQRQAARRPPVIPVVTGSRGRGCQRAGTNARWLPALLWGHAKSINLTRMGSESPQRILCGSPEFACQSLAVELAVRVARQGAVAQADARRYHVGRHPLPTFGEQLVGVEAVALGRSGDQLNRLAEHRVVDAEGHALPTSRVA